jgi:hypothetical protein
MRIMIATAVLALFMTPHSVSAQDRAAPDARNPEVSTSKAYTAEESAKMARAARGSRGAGTGLGSQDEDYHERHLHRLLSRA